MILKEKLRTVVALALVFSLTGALGSSLTFAQQTDEQETDTQEATTLTREEQENAFVLSSEWQSIAPGEVDSYSFEYAGDNQPVTVRMDVSAIPPFTLDLSEGEEGAGFQIWTEELLAEAALDEDVSPIGIGRELEEGAGSLFWQADFGVAETYVVLVNADDDERFQYLLTISGPGLIAEEEAVDAPAIQDTAPQAAEDAQADTIQAAEVENIATVITGVLNVREGPATTFPILTSVPQGTPLTVQGQDAANAWISVQLPDGREGWVFRTLTDFVGAVGIVETPATVQIPPAAPPATGIEAQPAAPAMGNIATVTAGALNVRQGPSTLFPIIRAVPLGTQLTVLGQDATSTWLSVQLADGTQGWVSWQFVNYIGTPDFAEAPALPPLTPTPAQVQPAQPVQPPLAPPAQQIQPAPQQPGLIDPAIQDPAVLAPQVTDETLPADAIQLEDPPVAETLGANWRVLSEDEASWYTFHHVGDGLPVHVWMDVEPNEGAGFHVFSAENAEAVMTGTVNPQDASAIGRGTPNDAEPSNLFWRGVFEEAGEFYIMVEHGWEGDIQYSIYAAGPGLGQTDLAQPRAEQGVEIPVQ